LIFENNHLTLAADLSGNPQTRSAAWSRRRASTGGSRSRRPAPSRN